MLGLREMHFIKVEVVLGEGIRGWVHVYEYIDCYGKIFITVNDIN